VRDDLIHPIEEIVHPIYFMSVVIYSDAFFNRVEPFEKLDGRLLVARYRDKTLLICLQKVDASMHFVGKQLDIDRYCGVRSPGRITDTDFTIACRNKYERMCLSQSWLESTARGVCKRHLCYLVG
jgi:hypothetical protein